MGGRGRGLREKAVLHKNAVSVIDDLGDEFTILVWIYDTLAVNLLTGFGGEVIPNGSSFGGFFKQFHLIDGNRCASITFDAADAMTLREVATEEGLEKVERDESVEDFNHEEWMKIGK